MVDRPSNIGVEIATWGSSYEGGNGMGPYIDTRLFGGNVGHARLDITLPLSKQTDELIKKYCKDPNDKTIIPYKKDIRNITRIINGQRITEQEEVIIISWSWWNDLKEYLSTEEREDERKGVEHAWSPEAIKRLKLKQPERRKYGGLAGARVIKLGPRSIVHKRELSDASFNLLAILRKKDSSNDQLKTVETLHNKINNIILKSTPENIEQIEKLVPNWHEKSWANDFNNTGVITSTNFRELVDMSESEENKQKVLELFIGKDKLSLSTQLMCENLEIEWSTYVNSPPIITAKELFRLRDAITDRKKELEQSSADLQVQYASMYKEHQNITNIDKITALLNTSDPEKGLDINKEGQELLEHLNEMLAKHGFIEFLARHYQIELIDDPNQTSIKYHDLVQDEHHLSSNEIESLKGLLLDLKGHYQDNARFFVSPELSWQYETLFQAPDNVQYLPLKSDPSLGINSGTEQGLDIEEMLKEMQTMSTMSFDLNTLNCSKTVGRIIAKGINDPALRDFFNQEAFGYIGNPQVVFNNVTKIQQHLQTEKKLPWYKGTTFLTKAQGRILETLLNSDSTKKQKRNAVFKAFFISPFGALIGAMDKLFDGSLSTSKQLMFSIGIALLAIPSAIVTLSVKMITNPLLVNRQAKKIINYTFSRNSTLLRIGAIVIGAPIIAITQIPASIQNGAKGLRQLIKKPFRKSSVKKLKAKEQETLTTPKQMQNIDQMVRAKIKKAEVSMTKKEHHSIEHMIEEAEKLTQQGKVVLFDDKRVKKLLKHLPKDDSHLPHPEKMHPSESLAARFRQVSEQSLKNAQKISEEVQESEHLEKH